MVAIIESQWGIKKDLIKDLPHIASVLSFPPAYYQKRLQKIGFTGKDAKLLDAACGCGAWALAASYLNKRVDGIDATPKYLAVAQVIQTKHRRKNLRLRLGRLERLPYPDEYFDCIVCYDAWMYTQREKSLSEMKRVLKPGGNLYLGCVAGLGWYLALIAQGLGRADRGLILLALRAIKNHVFMSRRESLKLLTKHHFQVLGLAPDGQIGDSKVKIEPVYPAKFLGFIDVYEILAQKKGNDEN